MLYIYSSKIASITKYNKYVSTVEFIQLFQTYLYKNNEEMEIDDKVSCDIEYLNISEKINKELPDKIKNKLDKLVNKVDKKPTNKNLIKQSETLKKFIDNSELTDDTKILLEQEVTRKLNCKFGTNSENTAIKQYEKETKNKVYGNNDKLYTLKCKTFYICGKVDGFVDIDNETYIFEMKNRKNRIFKIIPEYEKIQLLCYSKMLKNKNIIFSQCYNKKLNTEIMKEYDDIDLWKIVINRLETYISTIELFRKDEKIRHEYLKLNDDDKYTYLDKYLHYL